jgi:hypothetical protein
MKTATIICFAAIIVFVQLTPAAGQEKQEVTREKILSAGPQWQEKYDKYDPVPDMLDLLKTKFGPDISMDVYLGLWCPDSRNNVPVFLKILDRAGTAVPVRYFDVPRKANRQVKYYIEEMQIEKVPTFIIYRDGTEIGRIKENPKIGMLEDLMDILLK